MPRDKHKIIRAAFTLLTRSSGNNDNSSTSSSNDHMIHKRKHRIIDASIISINGSARTSKIATLRVLRKWFTKKTEMMKMRTMVKQNDDNGKQVEKKKRKKKELVTNAMLTKFHNEMEEICRVIN